MRFRLTQPEDFQTAAGFIPKAYRYPAALFEALPGLWASLLQSGHLVSAVLEDPEAPSDQCVRGIGLTVFIDDAFADDMLAHPKPYVNARLHELILSGRSPLLGPKQIAAHNLNSGLTLMPLHFCTPSVDFRDQAVMRILHGSQELFRYVHAGYRVKRVVKDVVNHDLCQIMMSTGMRLVCDYASQMPELGLAGLPERERPYLLAVRHEEMPLGSPMHMMFKSEPVRFRFTPAEQRVLLCALLRETDADIAHDLGLTHDTVRKHWKSIFHRIQSVEPDLLPSEGNGQGSRGREKKRHLLRYIQMHMEELRPHQI